MATPHSDSQTPSATRSGLPALGLTVLAAFGLRTIGHTSLWSHLATGRLITTDGIPRIDTASFATVDGTKWIAESWLYDVVLFLLWKGGPALATLVHLAAVLAAFALLLPLARRFSGAASTLFALLLSAWLIAPVFEVRPEILVLPIPALFLCLLATSRTPALRWSGILVGQVLWTNASPTFWMGPLICAAFALEATLRNRQPASDDATAPAPSPAGSMWMLTGAALAMTLVNPYGPMIYQQLATIFTDPTSHLAIEWVSPFSTLFQSALAKTLSTAALAVGAAGLLLYREKLPTALTIVAVVAAAITVLTGRNFQLFSLLAFPFFVLSFGSAGQFLNEMLGRRADQGDKPGAVAAILISLVSLGVVASSQYYRHVGSASGFGLGIRQDLVAMEADAVLAQPTFPDRALNLVQDGGYLRWAYPDRPILFDARSGLYDPADLDALYTGLSGNREAYAALMKKWDPQAIILNATHLALPQLGAAVPFLLQTGDWKLAYFDGTTPILVRPSLTTSREAQQHGLAVLEAARNDYRAQIEGPLGAPVSPRLVGAASTFYALQRFPEAAAAYDLLLKNAPAMKACWLPYGISCLQLNQLEEAVVALEKACAIAGKKSAAPYLWLSRAHAQAGRAAEAADAFARGQDINPEEASRFGTPDPRP